MYFGQWISLKKTLLLAIRITLDSISQFADYIYDLKRLSNMIGIDIISSSNIPINTSTGNFHAKVVTPA
jgi:hypothetical protein